MKDERIRSFFLEKKLKEKLNFTKKESDLVIEIIFGSIFEELKNDREVKIRNFGTFKVVKRRKSVKRNPQTNETFLNKEKKYMRISNSQKTKRNLNGE